jgi:phosphoserine phosphatase RsbU/P
MPGVQSMTEISLEVISPDRMRRTVALSQFPFSIGRGESGNQLALNDRRISRQCAAIVAENGEHYVEDRGQHLGVFVNGEKIDRRALKDGDVITFGLADSYQVVFHTSADNVSIPDMLTLVGNLPGADTATREGDLARLNLLLEASMLLHSRLPLEAVLGTVLDHAIAVTDADRGLLLEPDGTGSLRPRLARGIGKTRLPLEGFSPSQTALRMALSQHSSVITQDLATAGADLQAAQSIVSQQLRSVVVIPLYAIPRIGSGESLAIKRGDLLGALYVDSRRPTAFSKVDRQILDALAVQAASILDNARMVERERERQKMEQELTIARDIQQALLPRGFRDFAHLAVTGINFPCLSVGGDYFDVFPMGNDRTAFLIADVSGKGLGAALVTTMLQGAFSGLAMGGGDPVSVFRHLNSFLTEHTEVGRYATVFFGILENSGILHYINAGHPSPLLLRHEEISEAFTEGCCPVGLFPEIEFSTARIQLEPGDTLVLFSDGVTEAVDTRDEMYGVARLRDALAGKHTAPLGDIQKVAVESVQGFSRGASQADDITLLLVRYHPAA